MTEIDTRQLDAFIRKAQKIPSDIIAVTSVEFHEWGGDVVSELTRKQYPPENPGQRYVRTFTLKHSYFMQRVSKFALRILNNAAKRGKLYPVFVVGDSDGRGQAFMHRGRWWRAIEVIQESFETKLPAKLAKAYQRYFRSKF